MNLNPGSFGKFNKQLEWIASVAEEEERLTLAAYPNYKNSPLSLEQIRDITEDMSIIYSEEEEKSKPYLDPSPFRFGENIFLYTTIPEALKEILAFLKDIDDDLYKMTLNIYLGQSTDSINIYSIHEERYRNKIKSGELESDSHNNGGEFRKTAYIVLDKELDFLAAKKINKILGLKKCSFFEKISIMHETAHFFDKPKFKKAITLADLVNLNFEPFPQLTSSLLAETTAIFFAIIFAQFLVQKTPALQTITDKLIEKRILLNTFAVEKTYAITSLLSSKRDYGYIPADFLNDFVDETEAQDFIDDLVAYPHIHHDKRYSLSQLFVPTMVKIYNENKEAGKARIKRYIDCCRNDDLMGALKSFDLDITNQKNYNYLLENFREFISKYYFKNKLEPDIDR